MYDVHMNERRPFVAIIDVTRDIIDRFIEIGEEMTLHGGITIEIEERDGSFVVISESDEHDVVNALSEYPHFEDSLWSSTEWGSNINA